MPAHMCTQLGCDSIHLMTTWPVLLADTQPTISWPGFIIGCVLLLVAVVAFFWGFWLGDKLGSNRHFLLMWILPLSSGFASFAFAGSLKATGPIGQIAITATGGFAVWLLSYFLLPKPAAVAPPSLSVKLLPDMSFRGAAEFLANLDGYSVAFTGLSATVLSANVKEGQITAAGVLELMEQLKHRFVDETIQVSYRVVKDSTRGLFQIDV